MIRRTSGAAVLLSVLFVAGGSAPGLPPSAVPDGIPSGATCLSPRRYGTYTVRACIEHTPAGTHTYADISLDPDRPCELGLRYPIPGDWVSDLYPTSCPTGAITEFREETWYTNHK